MPRNIRKEVEIYPEDEDNLFHSIDDQNTLYLYYTDYVRKNGTNDWINTQYILRKKELDILDWRNNYFN